MEAINLNLIPNGTNPVVHCSQYDEGREFRFNLFDGASVFVLDGTEDITCDIKKPDGNIVTAAVPNTEDDYIIVTTTLQMCACSGNSLGTINISKGGVNLYTLNFVLYCERSPLENGIESESSIHNLNTMVAEMVAEEVATQYDSANVIFDNAPTSGHGTPYTVTSEGIKTAIDNAFDYDNTASGSLVHIEDGADNIPVKSLVSQITAVESGNGQPKSPDNPYTISGFDKAIITRCGKNFVDYTNFTSGLPNTTIGSDVTSITATSRYAYYGFKSPKGIVTISASSSDLNHFDEYYVYGYANRKLVYFSSFQEPHNVLTIDVSSYDYIRIAIGSKATYNVPLDISSIGYIQLVKGNSTTFEAYNGNTYTFAFGQTVYGGYFDNKGNLVVTHVLKTPLSTQYSRNSAKQYYTSIFSDIAIGEDVSCLSDKFRSWDGSEALWTDGICFVTAQGRIRINTTEEYASVSDMLADYGTITFCCKLATPITLAITSQDIPTLLGENNIFSNCGDVEVDYYTSKSNDILEFINSEIGKKNGTNIPIEANSQDSIKDYVDDEISSTKDYVDNGLNDKVAYKSDEVVYSNYVTGAYVSGSGNYVEFCIPINTKATSGTITNLGTTLNVFIGNTRLTNEVTLTDSSIVAIKDGYAQIELKLNSTQTANSVATVSLDGFTVNFA